MHRGVKIFIATVKTTVPKTVHLVEPDWDSPCCRLLGNADSSNKASDSRLLLYWEEISYRCLFCDIFSVFSAVIFLVVERERHIYPLSLLWFRVKLPQ